MIDQLALRNGVIYAQMSHVWVHNYGDAAAETVYMTELMVRNVTVVTGMDLNVGMGFALQLWMMTLLTISVCSFQT